MTCLKWSPGFGDWGGPECEMSSVSVPQARHITGLGGL